MFNRKQDHAKGAIPLRRTEDEAASSQPPEIPANSYQPASVIGNDFTIEGNGITIRCQGLLTVNGDISADVHSRQLDVGREGQVTGSVAAENVEIRGKIKGAIRGARVVLHDSADVDGDIHTQFLTIQEGASFDGRSRKVHDLSEVAPQINGGHDTEQQSVYQQPAGQAEPVDYHQQQAAPDTPKPQFGAAVRPLHS